MAEGEGFEPSVRTRTTVFETAPFDHSGTPPGIQKDIVKVSIIVGQVIEHRKRNSNMEKIYYRYRYCYISLGVDSRAKGGIVRAIVVH